MSNDEHISKYIDIIEAALSKSDVQSVFRKAVKTRNASQDGRGLSGMKNKLLKRGEVSVEDLFKMWNKMGRPDDLDDLQKILKKAGFSSGEIGRSYKKVGVDQEQGSDSRVTNLGNVIRKLNLQDYVIDYLKDSGIKESVQLDEKVLDDKSIASIFKNLAMSSSKEQSAQQGQSIDNFKSQVTQFQQEMQNPNVDQMPPKGTDFEVNDTIYIRGPMMWMRENPDTGKMSPAPKDKQQELTQIYRQKIVLDDMLNRMNDRRGTPEFDELQGTIAAIIKNSAHPQFKQEALQMLKTGQNESLTYDRNNAIFKLNEEVIDDLFRNVIDLHLYGRRKKI